MVKKQHYIYFGYVFFRHFWRKLQEILGAKNNLCMSDYCCFVAKHPASSPVMHTPQYYNIQSLTLNQEDFRHVSLFF